MPFVVLVCWSVKFLWPFGIVRCLRQAAGVTCSRFPKVPPLVPHTICDSGLSGQFRAALGWSFPVGSQHDFSLTPASKEHSILSLRSVSLVLPFPFALYVWACSLTSPLIPLINLRLRPSISDMSQQPFASYNVNFALLTPGICQSSIPALISCRSHDNNGPRYDAADDGSAGVSSRCDSVSTLCIFVGDISGVSTAMLQLWCFVHWVS